MATEREFDPNTFFQALTTANLNEVIEADKLEEFHAFLQNRGIPAKRFVISIPFVDGRLWAAFEINKVAPIKLTLTPKLKIHIKPPIIYIGDNPNNKTLPRKIENSPVWWLDEQMEGI